MKTIEHQWLPGTGVDRDEQAEDREFSGCETICVICNDGYMSLYICPNLWNIHHQMCTQINYELRKTYVSI